MVIDRSNLKNEALWKKSSTHNQGASIPLAIKVVSTNWRDDYYLKYADYKEMGISEYWIIDYAALGGRNFTGNPKQPTISVCNLVDGKYQVSKFQNSDSLRDAFRRLISQIFPDLNLTAIQIFQAGIT